MAYGVTRIWTSTSTKYTSISLDNSILGANASLTGNSIKIRKKCWYLSDDGFLCGKYRF